MTDGIKNVQYNLARQHRQGTARIRVSPVGLEYLWMRQLFATEVSQSVRGQLTALEMTNRFPNLRSKSSLLARQCRGALFTVSMVILLSFEGVPEKAGHSRGAGKGMDGSQAAMTNQRYSKPAGLYHPWVASDHATGRC